jgi:hypothetical protein
MFDYASSFPNPEAPKAGDTHYGVWLVAILVPRSAAKPPNLAILALEIMRHQAFAAGLLGTIAKPL